MKEIIFKIFIYLILVISIYTPVYAISGQIGSKETSPIVPITLFIIVIGGLIFVVSYLNKFRAKILKSYANQRGYAFSHEDKIGLTDKCNSTIGLKGKIAKNIVSYSENNESYFIFTWDDMDKRNYNVCLIETTANFNCSMLVLPLGKFSGTFKNVAAIGVGIIRNLNEVKLDNIEFNNSLTLYTDNQSTAFQLLSDAVIKYTMEHLEKFRTGPVVWGLGKNMIAVCSRKLRSSQEIDNLVNYSKKLKDYLIKK